jgi:CPA2 family monovalent cation:H+ antiporter-2
MQLQIGFLIVLLFGLLGGLIAKLTRMPLISGYILAGLLASSIVAFDIEAVRGLAEIGLLLLLFSVGLDLSLARLTHTGSVAIIGSILQMLIVGFLTYLVLILLHIPGQQSVILASGFSLSSTALVIKTLEDKSELDSIHGEIMTSWLLTQDLAVIPIMALLPALHANFLSTAGLTLLKSIFLLSAAFFLGRKFAPFIIHNIASTNKRELLVLGGVVLAIGTALLVSYLGIAPSIGAFLAGVVISETQENHAIFSETRPLRDLFVIIFFVTLGYFVNPSILINDFPLIAFLVALNIILKIIVVYILLHFLGYRGKTQYAVSLGLAQIGEFSFVIFLQSSKLGLLDERFASIGIATTLISLIITPFIYKQAVPLWRKYGKKTYDHKHISAPKTEIKNHVIICGYGRMGRWIALALDKARIPFIVIDYNQNVIHKARKKGIKVLYGDPAEPDILSAASVSTCKAIVVAIPDLVTQEEVISFCQTHYPSLSIYARAHLDEDVTKIASLKVKKVVQPEFEGALSVVRQIFREQHKNKDQINDMLSNLRRLHTIST